MEVTESSGNVFEDLGIPNHELHLFKAELVNKICVTIKKLRLNQKQAAKKIQLDQPKVSSLLKGNFAGFSTDRLFRCLILLDQDVQINITQASTKGTFSIS